MPRRAGAKKRAANQALAGTSQECTKSGTKQVEPARTPEEQKEFERQLMQKKDEEADRRRKARSEEVVIHERVLTRIEFDPECNNLRGVLQVVDEEFREMLVLRNQHKDMIRGLDEEVARRLAEE